MKAKLPPAYAPPGEIKRDIRRRVAAENEQYMRTFEAMILWTLHESCGFGKVRLERFYRDFIREYNEMRERYEMDVAYPAERKLREIGVDLDKLWEMEGGKT